MSASRSGESGNDISAFFVRLKRFFKQVIICLCSSKISVGDRKIVLVLSVTGFGLGQRVANSF